MTRLPSCDRSTTRGETAAFISIGLVSFALVAMAVANGSRFAAERDSIIAALEGGPLPARYAGSSLTNLAGTNAPAPERDATGGKVPARSTVSAPQE